MRNNRVSQPAQNHWTQIRQDLYTLAQYYSVTSTWDDNVNMRVGQVGYTVTDAQMRTLLNRLQSRTNSFIQSYNNWNRNIRNRQMSASSNVEQDINDYSRALADLRINFNDRNSVGIGEVLRPAVGINRFVTTNRPNNTVISRWTLVRNDLDMLSNYYRTAIDWNNTYNPYPGSTYPNVNYGNFDSQLSGTYRLNIGQSENVRTVVDRAIISARYPANQADRMRANLERRLASPETLTFEKRGQQVRMATANMQSVELTADGVRRTETSPNGRSVTTTVTERNGQLAIDYEGDRMNDFHLTFTPVNNTQLRVTRRIYLENNNQSVTVASVYDKTSQSPQWGSAYPPNYSGSASDQYVVANNTAITATLNNEISTRSARDGDRFSMTITSPLQYSGAVIEGVVNGQRSGGVSGRATMALVFETIRLTDGRSFAFAGIVDQVRDVNGNSINVDNEGSVRDRSQTTQTVARAGVGAVIGAIIGAIAGGGSGAAVGAGVGAGAGAGTVILQGRDNLELRQGTQFFITAGAPANVSSR
ncbi:MAG: hypothetical protein IPM50_04345 [Acidobacteriota bacterium]|nr:MAG: hypothetical protein IPM50_04345 [Acidobacteriota bacterium]